MSDLGRIERLSFAHLPTPLEDAPRLGEAFGLSRLRIKRDDATGLALGGNKARKLEYLLADALRRGADTVLTCGGVQSNHARMTAAAACRLGLHAILFLDDPEPVERQGNLLLDDLLGAEVRFLPVGSLQALYTAMEACAAELAAQGRTPYIIPVGGSTPLGSLGYVRAVAELAEQTREREIPVRSMVVATGSTGTLAGMALGVRIFLPEARVIGISVSSPAERCRSKAARIASEAAELIRVPERFAPDEFVVYDEFIGEAYGVPTAAGQEALTFAARCEGLVMDPVYTGKALAGLRALAARGVLDADEDVVFWHTGGAPALFAFAPDVAATSGERAISDSKRGMTTHG
jgi:D-cysteine desulfhydrase family pyridoxal phosphate-dependent enzyme